MTNTPFKYGDWNFSNILLSKYPNIWPLFLKSGEHILLATL